ncbi:MAG: GC-type dockerin domain-anchored protein, partial [Phycisphaerales bacterium]
VPLGPNVDEALAGTNVWSDSMPAGWSVDDSGVPGVGNPNEGVTEWEGWACTNRAWWVQAAGDQNRSQFTRGVGTIAVADPDEWDDRGNPEGIGAYNAAMLMPEISLAGYLPNSLRLAFDSSWRPEGLQRARITASYDGGAPVTVMQWDSFAGPTFKPDATNERVEFTLANPAGASDVRLTFWMLDARNNWWWAIDNVEVTAIENPCRADTNADGGVDGDDVITFFAAWDAGQSLGDFNGDGGVDGDDVIAFFARWDSGC